MDIYAAIYFCVLVFMDIYAAIYFCVLVFMDIYAAIYFRVLVFMDIYAAIYFSGLQDWTLKYHEHYVCSDLFTRNTLPLENILLTKNKLIYISSFLMMQLISVFITKVNKICLVNSISSLSRYNLAFFSIAIFSFFLPVSP